MALLSLCSASYSTSLALPTINRCQCPLLFLHSAVKDCVPALCIHQYLCFLGLTVPDKLQYSVITFFFCTLDANFFENSNAVTILLFKLISVEYAKAEDKNLL